MRSEFEKTNTFKSVYSTLMYFDEGLNVYVSNSNLRREDAIRLSYAWWGYQEQQQKIDKALKRADHACICTAMFHKQFNDIINILRGEEC